MVDTNAGPPGEDDDTAAPIRRAGATSGTGRPLAPGVVLAAVVVLVAFNLRPAVTAVGPLLPDLQAQLDMTGTIAGVLTSLPVLAFGIVGLVTNRVARRFGARRSITVALALVALGQLARAAAPNAGWLLASTVAVVVGIAVANVLVPVAVKRWFPHRLGRVTGLYVMSMSVSTAIAAAGTVPVAAWAGTWRAGLGIWALPAAVALGGWITTSRSERADLTPQPEPPGDPVAVHRNPKAWALTLFFGLQALEAYTVMGWLPAIMQSAGLSASYAGVLLGVTMGVGAPIALVLPEMAARRDDQRLLVAGLVTLSAVAYVGLLLAPTAAPLLWAVVLGVALGAFPLALLLLGLRTATARGTADLSALTQGVGYLVAATGPIAVGLLRDLTGGWDVPLAALAVLMIPKLLAGLVAGRPGVVDRV